MQIGAVAVEDPRIVHALPGRVRIYLPAWSGHGSEYLERRLRLVRGVCAASANPLTRNVLVRFDPALTSERHVVAALVAVVPVPPAPAEPTPAVPSVPSADDTLASLAYLAPHPFIPAGSVAERVAEAIAAAAWPEWRQPETRTDVAHEPASPVATLVAAPLPRPQSEAAPTHDESTWRRLLPLVLRLETLDFALKVIGVLMGLLSAGSAVGLALSSVEAVRLFAETRARWPTMLAPMPAVAAPGL